MLDGCGGGSARAQPQLLQDVLGLGHVPGPRRHEPKQLGAVMLEKAG